MDAIKIFDERFKPFNSYYALGCNIIKYIATAFSVGTMMFFPLTEEDLLVNFYVLMFFCYGTFMQTQPYLYTKQNKSTVPIYKLMRDTPISRKDFINSRLHYLYKYVSKFAVACVAVRLISIILLEDNLTLERVLISMAAVAIYIGFATGFAILDIHAASRY